MPKPRIFQKLLVLARLASKLCWNRLYFHFNPVCKCQPMFCSCSLCALGECCILGVAQYLSLVLRPKWSIALLEYILEKKVGFAHASQKGRLQRHSFTHSRGCNVLPILLQNIIPYRVAFPSRSQFLKPRAVAEPSLCMYWATRQDVAQETEKWAEWAALASAANSAHSSVSCATSCLVTQYRERLKGMEVLLSNSQARARQTS